MPRKPRPWLLGMTVLLGLSAFMAGQTPPETGDDAPATVQNEADLWAQFQIIVERNIFSRQRGRRQREASTEPERPRYVPTPESRIVLKGIVNQNGTFVAFFEDTGAGAMLNIRAGDAVARGKVEALTLDHVVFQHEDQTRIVTLGQSLEGKYGSGNIGYNEVMEWSESSSASAPSGETAAPAADSPSSEESDILKKMMERRRQEIGG